MNECQFKKKKNLSHIFFLTAVFGGIFYSKFRTLHIHQTLVCVDFSCFLNWRFISRISFEDIWKFVSVSVLNARGDNLKENVSSIIHFFLVNTVSVSILFEHTLYMFIYFYASVCQEMKAITLGLLLSYQREWLTFRLYT